MSLSIRRIARWCMAGLLALAAIAAPAAAQQQRPALQRPTANQVDTKGQGPKRSDTVVHVKFAEDSGLRVRNGRLASTDRNRDIGPIEDELDQLGVTKIERMFRTADEARLDRDKDDLERRSGRNLKNLNTWAKFAVRDKKAVEVAAELKKKPWIENAYAEPYASLTYTSGPDKTVDQLYRNGTPVGINANGVNTGIPGALGENVRVTDVEFNWNENHEDLSRLRQPNTNNTANDASDPSYEENHGTAVMGEILGDHNGKGINGIVPNASAGMASALNRTVADAINAARLGSEPGDVIILELQFSYFDANGNDIGYVPLETYQAEYDAISTATAAGVIVMEAAANGNVNLDDPMFANIFGPNGRPDSGAIMVGAGNPSLLEGCVDQSFVDANPARSRASFSDYGSRVNFQGWGYCVATTGYGGYDANAPNDAKYTPFFSGTSSATPIVTGAAAAVSSAFQAKNGRAPTPAEVRSLLASSATPQSPVNPTSGISEGNIGPMPNLPAALAAVTGTTTDTQAPSTPTNVKATLNPQGYPYITFNASTDNVGVTGYTVYRNGTVQGNSTDTQHTDQTAAQNTTYNYTVVAFDAAGNKSAQSASVSITTPFFTENFGSGNLSAWTGVDRFVNQTAIHNSPSYAGRATSTAGTPSYVYKTLPTTRSEVYIRSFVMPVSQGNNNARFIHVRTADGATTQMSVYRDAAGKLLVFNPINGNTKATATAVMPLGKWYDLQTRVKINGTSGIVEVWLDGNKLNDLTMTTNMGTAPIGRIYLGENQTGRNYDTVYDTVYAGTGFLKTR